ncbi:alginate biosynthesis TPR repeat lipoprotein AlgK [Pseudomonas sp. UL073]|uniref:Alginate biosynthesis TPR repeat lipoprotein AlgK n=2 Tax=Zestomonas insulae TaxID=2809017 RepID=A0ABS2IAK8_9GAMM|nr:alginate biosynthesis TPR repeat lipoprotein AlgK [Pseudomonas insulae]MBM7060040.1 alginate biosynthesis TPR repeat lipoprotein AlgK [Pseudomonas insulae]
MAGLQPQLLLLSAAVALALAGCAGLPDQRLAQEALARGDTATAEQNYQQLANLGYTEAQVGMADIYVESGDPEALRKAEATYRQAAEESPRAAARLGRLLASKPNASDAERREAEALLKRAAVGGEQNTLLPLALLYLQYPQAFPQVNAQQQISQWRAEGQPQADLAQILLYRTQGTYDQHLDEIAKICEQALATNDVCYVELATVYQKRGQADKQQALLERLRTGWKAGSIPPQRLDSVANVLADPAIGTPDGKAAKGLLEEIAPSYPAAWVSLARLLYDYPDLGDTEEMLGYLNKGREAAQPRADLLFGKLYYEGKLVPQDPFKAEQHLLKAAAAGESGANYYLGQIYRRGFLGQVYPDKALQRLLTSARGGQPNADMALAQMYSQGRGVQPDPVNAYVFSQLSLLSGKPEANDLAAQIALQLPANQRARAESLLQAERQYRGTQPNAAQTAAVAAVIDADDSTEAAAPAPTQAPSTAALKP